MTLKTWNNFISSLTFEQLGALTHFLSALFVVFCLLNIISVIYGDFLIRFLKLEIRFPRLAKFIQLRRKFQLYYMSIFFLAAFINLLAVMYLDLLVFFSALG